MFLSATMQEWNIHYKRSTVADDVDDDDDDGSDVGGVERITEHIRGDRKRQTSK